MDADAIRGRLPWRYIDAIRQACVECAQFAHDDGMLQSEYWTWVNTDYQAGNIFPCNDFEQLGAKAFAYMLNATLNFAFIERLYVFLYPRFIDTHGYNTPADWLAAQGPNPFNDMWLDTAYTHCDVSTRITLDSGEYGLADWIWQQYQIRQQVRWHYDYASKTVIEYDVPDGFTFQ